MKLIVEYFYNWYRSQIRHPQYRWLMILGTVAYLLDPFDVFSDFIPMIGWIDDGIVLTLLTTELSKLALDYRNRRKEVISTEIETTNADVIDVSAH